MFKDYKAQIIVLVSFKCYLCSQARFICFFLEYLKSYISHFAFSLLSQKFIHPLHVQTSFCDIIFMTSRIFLHLRQTKDVK